MASCERQGFELTLQGVDVAITTARNPDRLEAAALEMSQETGGRIVPVSSHTWDEESVRGIVRTVADAFGHLDILLTRDIA